jgi:hypothetical protein
VKPNRQNQLQKPRIGLSASLSSNPRRGEVPAPEGGFSSQHASIWLNLTLRLVVGGAFVLAGALKVADPARFAGDVGNYRILPHALVNLTAILLPPSRSWPGCLFSRASGCARLPLVVTSLTGLFFLLITSALVPRIEHRMRLLRDPGRTACRHREPWHRLRAFVICGAPGGPCRRGQPEKFFRDAGARIPALPNEAR